MNLVKLFLLARELKKECKKVAFECRVKGSGVSFFRMYHNRPVIINAYTNNGWQTGHYERTDIDVMVKPGIHNVKKAEFVTCTVSEEPTWAECINTADKILEVEPCGHSWV